MGSSMKGPVGGPNGNSLSRPTVGLLSPRKVIVKPSARMLKALARSKSLEYSAASPPRYRVTELGIGMVVIPQLRAIPVDSEESALERVRCYRTLPPIRAPARVIEWTDDDDDKKQDDDVAAFCKQLTTLHLRLNNMDEHVAETLVEMMELEDKVDVLHKAMTSKVKRLAKVTGNEHLHGSPGDD